MKILQFAGGLGNQIFGYAFYLYIKRNFSHEKIYGYYPGRSFRAHNGLEIDKWFDVKLPHSTLFSDAIFEFFHILYYIGIKSYYNKSRAERPDLHIAMTAFHLDRRSVPTEKNWLRFKVDENTLSTDNKKILADIRSNKSYFIHVRRGDYISEKYIERYGTICTTDYYNTALNIIKEKNNNVTEIKFFVFSDDMDYVKNNLNIDNAVYVDINKGENSPLDMYLMSQCNGGIMANSTFSYFGAYLCKQDVIVYPKKWTNNRKTAPDIFLENWIGI